MPSPIELGAGALLAQPAVLGIELAHRALGHSDIASVRRQWLLFFALRSPLAAQCLNCNSEQARSLMLTNFFCPGVPL